MRAVSKRWTPQKKLNNFLGCKKDKIANGPYNIRIFPGDLPPEVLVLVLVPFLHRGQSKSTLLTTRTTEYLPF
jgi:hypothetical protein